MANRFPLIVKTGQVNTVEELASGDNLDLTGNGIVVDSDKILSLPQVTTTLVGTNTSQTLSNKVLTLPKIGDTTGDHFYQFAVGELDGTRTITLPILSGNDEFVFKDHTQTLTNKTLTNPALNVGAGSLVLPQGVTPAQTAEGEIFWDTDDNLLTIGTSSGRKTFVDTDSTQTISGKTINNLTITGTLTAGGSAGTNNYVLKSTGTGVQWVQSSDAIAITDTTNATGAVYPLLVSETTGTLVDVDILTTKFSIDGPTGDVNLGSTTIANSSGGALEVAGGVKAGNVYISGAGVSSLSETTVTYTTGNASDSTGAYSVAFAVTAVNAYGETLGAASLTRYYPWSSNPTSHSATITWSAVTGATSYRVYRKTYGNSFWYLVETVPAANSRTHTTTFSISRTTSNPGTYYRTSSAGLFSTYYYYLSSALSPVNGTSSGASSTPKTTNTTAAANPLEVVGVIGAAALKLSGSSPLLNSSGTALEFVPKYSPTIYTGDGTTTTYSLAASGLTEIDLFVTVGGVPQTPGISYSYYVSGSLIIFTEAPNPDDRVVIRYNVLKVKGS